MDGSIGYHSIGFARADSGITSLDDMQGKVFGFGDPNSTSGYLIPSIDIDGGVTWADAQGNWEDGYNSGALRRAVDAGLVDMNELVQIWKSKVIPEGPVVLRQALPTDVKATMTELVDTLYERDIDCAYGVAAGETLGFQPVTHETYLSVIAARQAKIGG